MGFLAVGIGIGAVVVIAVLAAWLLVSVLAEVRDEEIDASDGDGRS